MTRRRFLKLLALGLSATGLLFADALLARHRPKHFLPVTTPGGPWGIGQAGPEDAHLRADQRYVRVGVLRQGPNGIWGIAASGDSDGAWYESDGGTYGLHNTRHQQSLHSG